jgi:hypothetical protein
MSSSSKVELKLDWATHQAAKYACENWHYSKRMPMSKTVKIGVWENSRFIGCVIYSPGATPQIGSPYNLKQTEICELTRVALTEHQTEVSKILSISFRMLKKSNPGLKLLISYADPMQAHHGGIYQASNWIYVGLTKPDCFLKVNGTIEHRKTIYDRYGNQSLAWLQKNVDPHACRIRDEGKLKYLMALDGNMKKSIQKLRKPYPKRVGSKDIVAVADQATEGGENPTPTLHKGVSHGG